MPFQSFSFAQKLAALAHEMANNLHINYFDVHDTSKRRILKY